ncbi:MAG TPA: hypothetical protein VF914_10015, partial [Chloroflexia bacterium]
MTALTVKPATPRAPQPANPAVSRPFLVRYYPAILVGGLLLVLVLLVAHVSIGTANVTPAQVIDV